MLHFSKTACDLDCICASICIWYGWGTNKVTWGKNSLVSILWRRAGTQIAEVWICWSVDLLKCGFAKMQICKNIAVKSMCNSSCLSSHLEMAHSHLATFTYFPELWAFSRVVSIFQSCEHFPELWAFFRVESIFQSCEHFGQLWAFAELWAFWRVVSIFQSCEHFGQLWAISRIVSIFQTCEHFLWAFSELWAFCTVVGTCSSCRHLQEL